MLPRIAVGDEIEAALVVSGMSSGNTMMGTGGSKKAIVVLMNRTPLSATEARLQCAYHAPHLGNCDGHAMVHDQTRSRSSYDPSEARCSRWWLSHFETPRVIAN
jgi:hypothetical protein